MICYCKKRLAKNQHTIDISDCILAALQDDLFKLRNPRWSSGHVSSTQHRTCAQFLLFDILNAFEILAQEIPGHKGDT